MQAIIQSLGSMVMALAVAAFAHFGVALRDCACPKAHPAAAVHHVSYVHPGAPRTIGRASRPLASDLHRA